MPLYLVLTEGGVETLALSERGGGDTRTLPQLKRDALPTAVQIAGYGVGRNTHHRHSLMP